MTTAIAVQELSERAQEAIRIRASRGLFDLDLRGQQERERQMAEEFDPWRSRSAATCSNCGDTREIPWGQEWRCRGCGVDCGR
jgi:transposase